MKIDEIELPDEDTRRMLRHSLRGLLEDAWPADKAIGRSDDPQEIIALWGKLVGLGLASLGGEFSEGALREIAIVMEELGRASCPAPMWGAALANLALHPLAGRLACVTDLLRRLHGGTSRIAFSFGAFDPDPSAACVSVDSGSVTGTARFVAAAASCTDLLLVVEGPALAIVDLGAPGVRLTPTRALGASGHYEISLDAVPAEFAALSEARVEDLRVAAQLSLMSRAHGAARRAFEMAVDYAKERQQFGQPIGRFQAIQHKLANCLIALEGVRLTLGNAAAQHDRRQPEWRYFADAAIAFAGGALRQVSLETQHTFGAIGYAEEHEAPRHFKAVHLAAVSLGGATRARHQLASRFLDGGGAPLPEYDLGPAGNAFREEARRWFDAHWSGARKSAFDSLPHAKREFDPEFAQDLGSTGWLGLGWPREFGGQGRTPLEQLAFVEVMERAEAPRAGAAIQANALMMFGTPAQQRKYLPEILRGEAMHGMGYSEPEAGSDLAALRTSAVRDGDEWIINGQKIWTTTWWGRYMFLAARTDPDAKPRHAGISMFIVPMASKGITIRPAETMYDGTFANIFYDNVRVPADALIGEVNGGWKVLTGALACERGLVGGGIVLKVAHAFERLCEHVRSRRGAMGPLRADPMVRDRIATLSAEIEVGRQLMIHCAELAVDGVTPPEYGAMSKVFSGELMERFGEAALDILGLQAALSEKMPGALDNGRFEQGLRHSLMWVISIGTNEIQRSLIAQRGLGLPR